MAYLKTIHRTCGQSGCTRAATQALFNTYNAHVGDFCTSHGQQRLKTLAREERMILAARPAPAAVGD